ncbi:hypothetical protein OEZ86_013450 [Tetradesmus obliquus]|nr:hypothetical protein OEZ86_013450 [Tetradesmus obliquus]
MSRNKPAPKRLAAQQENSAAGSSSSSSSSSSNPQVQKLAALLGNIKHTWRLHGKRFTSWWASLDKEARLKFLLQEGGSVWRLHFTPEWNQEELAKGTALTELIKDIAEIPDTGEPGAAEGYDAVTELCLRHLPFAHMVAPHVKASFLQRSSVAASSCCFQASWAGH